MVCLLGNEVGQWHTDLPGNEATWAKVYYKNGFHSYPKTKHKTKCRIRKISCSIFIYLYIS